MRKIKRTMVSACIGMLAFGAATSQSLAETVKVGGILSISGPAAAFGVPERDIIDILAKNLNDKGGINGKKVEMVFCDDQTNPTEAARCASELIRQHKVTAIIGSTTGSGTLALLPAAARAQVPVVAPVGTPTVTDKKQSFYPWAFRSSVSEKIILQGALEQGVLKKGHKRLAVMYQEDAFGKTGMEYAQEFAKEHGVEIVSTASAPLTAIDLTAAATKIRNSNPDVVLLQISIPTFGAAYVRAANQVGLKSDMVGTASLAQRSFLDAVGPAGEGVKIISAGNWDDPSKKLLELKGVLNAAGKEPKGFGELIGSSSFHLIEAAIGKVEGEVTGKKMRDALEKVCGLKNTFLEGEGCLSPDRHDAFQADSLIMLEIKNNKFRTIN